MTENERLTINGKEVILYREVETNLYRFSKDVVDLLLKAFEEVEQYRAIGTVKEIQQKLKNMSLVIDTDRNLLNRYIAIGTIEEFKALKEKNTPLEHHHTRIDDINDKVRVSVCPSCLSIIFTHSEEYPNFCVACGQKLDWSE